MSSDDPSARPATPIVLRIKLRYDDVEVMVQRFATNVGKSGLFLPTKSIQPIGSEIKFELRLADDTPVLVGLGRVKLARPPDPADPRATFGMAIELMRVTPQSRALILRMLEQRRELGLPELGLPTPDDIDAARHTEAVPPVAPPVAPPAGPPAGPIDAHGGEALLTAPRRTTGPLAVAKILAVAPLGPEPPRRKRAQVSEVIESASGSVAGVSLAVPGLDDDVDVAAALARARTLAGGSLEAELEALAEAAAAPVEISIDAASAELARQLGGSAVRRERSARWAPPPATKLPEPATPPPEPGAEGAFPAEADAEAKGEADADAKGEADADADADADAEPAVAPLDAPSDPDPALPAQVSEDEAAALPAQVSEEEAAALPPLNELDLEDVEHTERGDIPVPAFDGFTGEPSVVEQARLTESLEAHLDEAEAEADAENLELAAALGLAAPGDPAAAYERRAELEARADSAVDVNLDEIDDFEILAETDADDEDLLASSGEHDASDGDEVVTDSEDAIAQQPTGVRRPSGVDFAAQLDLGADSDLYYAAPPGEFAARDAIDRLHEDFAERHAHLDSAGQALAAFEDELGEDVLVTPPRGERRAVSQPIFDADSSNSFTLAGTPSEAVDLDDLHEARHDALHQARHDALHEARHDARHDAPPAAAARPTVPPTPTAPSRPSRPSRSSVAPPVPTAPSRPSRPSPAPLPADRAPAAEPRRPSRTPSAPIRKQPSTLRNSPFLPSLLDTPVEDHELESALEALDVDLDDLAIPHAATELQRDADPNRPRPATTIRPASRNPGPPAGRTGSPRAISDDGVVIDFDDDD